MSDNEPSVRISPGRPLTHSELIFDFIDFPSSTEFSVNITGPNPQPYWVMLKTDDFGQAQLIWRTQAAGDYSLVVKGDDLDVDRDFTVNYQAGEEELFERGIMQPDRDVKTVEEPGKMGDVSSGDMRPEMQSSELAEEPTEKKTTKRKASKPRSK